MSSTITQFLIGPFMSSTTTQSLIGPFTSSAMTMSLIGPDYVINYDTVPDWLRGHGHFWKSMWAASGLDRCV